MKMIDLCPVTCLACRSRCLVRDTATGTTRCLVCSLPPCLAVRQQLRARVPMLAEFRERRTETRHASPPR